KVQVRLPAGGSRTLAGTLSFVDNTIDPATGTILVKADFANTDGELWPGGLVPVTLMLATRQGVPVVPNQAVQTGQDGAHVYVVRGDATVEYRQVVAGPKSDGQTVIEKGLKAGERVVTDGHLQLVDGGKILDRSSKSDDQQGKKQTQGKS
ncbi:MAG: efflux RND transporter periplasmic adaptor subunit, partial [Desulfobulbaceae bacterium]